MSDYRISVISGWCGTLRIVVEDHLKDMLNRAGYKFIMTHQSAWDNPAPPSRAHLVLQLLPTFTEAETGCPVINIKPLLIDLNHASTIEKIMQNIEHDYPIITGENLPIMESTLNSKAHGDVCGVASQIS